ncbi:MAG TPA: alpha/beta hydrolase [Candidatus Eisenbacteria bacterium]|nr:alpha/beta hydrolase [Candidatus Eisenbacteria bacterium]
MPSPAPAKSRRRVSRLALAIALAALLAIAWFLFVPPFARFPGRPRPAPDYAQAIQRVEALRAADKGELHPLCRLELMTHGHRTERAVVLLHGLTNCPRQFVSLGRTLHERGANVLIARIPHHGLADRLTPDLANLTAQELTRFGDEVVDIGHGLGDSVSVAGLSLGAVLAAWLAQERNDVDRAVIIAPVFGVPQLWSPLTPGLTRFFLWIPNQFVWWDDKLREKVLGPTYVYPRFSTRGLGEVLRLGCAVTVSAGRAAPRARSITMVTIENDHAINNQSAREVVRAWRARAGERIKDYEFPGSLKLGHDLIDPLQPYQQVDVVYPVLADLMLCP